MTTIVWTRARVYARACKWSTTHIFVERANSMSSDAHTQRTCKNACIEKQDIFSYQDFSQKCCFLIAAEIAERTRPCFLIRFPLRTSSPAFSSILVARIAVQFTSASNATNCQTTTSSQTILLSPLIRKAPRFSITFETTCIRSTDDSRGINKLVKQTTPWQISRFSSVLTSFATLFKRKYRTWLFCVLTRWHIVWLFKT